MPLISVVIPVKDGERFLGELLASALSQAPDEVLVIDSGSSDRSRAIARSTPGVDVLEIAPADFGHGRTRNLGAEKTSGDLIVFLTQDAVPIAGWLDSYRRAFAAQTGLGAAYGPHLPRPETSPMIARELTEFFASMSPNGAPVVQGPGDLRFLSNVNACYSRECWKQIRFPDVAYAEDQGFAAAMLEAGWLKAYVPEAAVLHAHDYGALGFARRYFDEYRGLRAAIGHVEPIGVRSTARDVSARVRADHRWMRERGWPAGHRARWSLRSSAHHTGRRVFAALGSRADRLPSSVQRRLSLEGTASVAGPEVTVGASQRGPSFFDVLAVSRDGAAPLDPSPPGTWQRRRLHLAIVIPPFRRGSGGHSLIFALVRRLEGIGHTCTIWVHDPVLGTAAIRPAVVRRQVLEWFSPVRAPFFAGFDAWHGADVAVATGWDTAHAVARLPGVRARAYLVSDHEPDFYPASTEALFAAQTYGLGFYPICGSTWLRDLLAERYGAQGVAYRFGVDHDVYRRRPVERRSETVLFYARSATPRRAVALGVLALEELVARRPQLRVVTFGQAGGLRSSFSHEELGIATPGQLAHAYCSATIGLCLSLTNPSLIPQEMMACGLPCVDLAGGPSEAVFGADGPVELAEADPVALADAMEGLLDDEDRRRRRSEEGVRYAADASWDSAARQVERGLRAALRQREEASGSS